MREDSHASVAQSLEIMRPCPCPEGLPSEIHLGSHNCMTPWDKNWQVWGPMFPRVCSGFDLMKLRMQDKSIGEASIFF